nr:DNA gyrase C-terminal beta-propeller domain-containing protein [Candidatus Kuenenia stuttgartiensis]
MDHDNKGGKIIRTPVNTIRIIGRNTQGVKLFDIGKQTN